MATVIHQLEQLDSNKAYSYADYLLWEFEQRIELLKGKIFLMPHAPMNLKFHLYEENGVKEYWIADPNYHLIHQYFLNEAKHKYEIVGYFTEEDSIQSVLFSELIINVSEIFKD
jgi:hypothetical protein